MRCDENGDPEFTEDVNASTQAAVDQLVGCRSFPSYAAIGGGDVRDLTPLATLERIDGFLSLGTNQQASIQSLSGLDKLESIGDALEISNTLAPDLDPLSSLERIERGDVEEPGFYGGVNIAGNSRLQSIEGLRNLSGILSLGLLFNPRLTSTAGPVVAAQAETLTVRSTVVTDLTALRQVETARFVVVDAEVLTHLDDLASLTAVTQSMRINTPALASMAGLSKLQSVGRLTLRSLGAVDATPLSGLTSVRDLVLQDLQDTELGFAQLTSLEGGLTVERTVGFDWAGLPALRSAGRLVVTGNSDMTAISPPSLAAVDGDLVIHGNPALEHEDAVAFAETLSVAGAVKIYNNLNSPPPLGPCPYTDDGWCDEPDLCARGTDTNDCACVD